MKNLGKYSNVKVIKTGNIYEIYEYEKPYFWNFGAREKNGFEEVEVTKIGI